MFYITFRYNNNSCTSEFEDNLKSPDMMITNLINRGTDLHKLYLLRAILITSAFEAKKNASKAGTSYRSYDATNTHTLIKIGDSTPKADFFAFQNLTFV